MSTRKNTIYNMAYRLFSMLLPLITAPYLSRVVGTVLIALMALLCAGAFWLFAVLVQPV